MERKSTEVVFLYNLKISEVKGRNRNMVFGVFLSTDCVLCVYKHCILPMSYIVLELNIQ